MPEPNDPVDAVIAKYVQEVEAGQVPDREVLLAQHPYLADRLREFFADYDRLDRQAGELRLSADPHPTTDFSALTSDVIRVRYFGDYELLEVLAHGGMGVVHKARQVSLGRLVALKMILKGMFATPLDVARFRAEAEAAAKLDHPNIISIYEVGEHDGQQYYAMQFIDGTSLRRYPRGTTRKETVIIAQVARAVHHAHQRGVLHRDLKPSNILLDSAGTPFVADFGLAKRVNVDRSLTESGAVVGTPRYMSPEQAASQKDLSVAADVYSLGVVFYERLTGQTPFTGETPLQILRQVRENDPPRPSSITPGLDRDLETICLKCLEKEPGKRYDSAQALADDLDRWLRGEPIEARPVGQAERYWRWCRRNPVVAALSAGLVLALLIGSGISAGFAIQEHLSRKRAEKAEKMAVEAQDDLEQALARSFLRPLNPQGGDSNGNGLNEQETDALWELAQNSSDRLKLRFVQEAFDSPKATDQHLGRAEPFWVAAVGLDRTKADLAQRLLAERLNDPNLANEQQVKIAISALWLVDVQSPIDPVIVTVLMEELGNQNAPNIRSNWGGFFGPAIQNLSPSHCAELLTQAIETPTNIEFRQSLLEGAAKSDASHSIPLLLQVMRKQKDINSIAAIKLAGMAECLQESETAEIAEIFVNRMRGPLDPGERIQWANRLLMVTSELPKDHTSSLCCDAFRSLTQKPERSGESWWWSELPRTLTLLAGRMQLSDAARLAQESIIALRSEEDPWVISRLGSGIAALSRVINQNEKRMLLEEATSLLLKAFEKENDSFWRDEVAQAVVDLAKELQPAQGVQLLTKLVDKEKNKSTEIRLAEGQLDIAARLESDEAMDFLESTLNLKKESVRSYLPRVSERISAITWKLAPKDRTRLSGRTIQLMDDQIPLEVNAFRRRDLAVGVATLARNFDSSEAHLHGTWTCQRLFRTSTNPGHTYNDLAQLVDGFVALSSLLTSEEARQIATELMQKLLESMAVATGGEYWYEGELGLSMLFPFIGPERHHRIAKELTFRLCSDGDANGSGPDWQGRAANLYGLLSDRTEPELQRRALAAGSACGLGSVSMWAEALVLHAAAEPFPCHLSSQDLVELLKMPTCFGGARKIVLEHLGKRYGRTFANHWEFVRYAKDNGLKLDFTTPPKRPSRSISAR
jgi:predicted Ser/Thr protein kinase